MENLTQVRECLGGAKLIGSPKTELDFISKIREGFPFSTFISVRNHSKLSEEAIWSSLRIAKRTADRRKKEATKLKPIESELLFRLVRIFVGATEVLGSEEKGRHWLMTENRALGGETPISLLDTSLGFEEAMDLLTRIDQGVYS